MTRTSTAIGTANQGPNETRDPITPNSQETNTAAIKSAAASAIIAPIHSPKLSRFEPLTRASPPPLRAVKEDKRAALLVEVLVELKPGRRAGEYAREHCFSHCERVVLFEIFY